MTDPNERAPSLLDRWWVRLLAAAWVLGATAAFLRLQLGRALELLGVLP